MRLVLFCGLPHVGKTTISRGFCEANEGSAIDLDDFKRRDVDSALVKLGIDPPHVRWTYYRKALDHAQALFAQGSRLVAMDEVFHLSVLRRRIEEECRAQDIDVLWIEVRCPRDLVAHRLASSDRAGHLLSSQESLWMHRRFETLFEPFDEEKGRHVVLDNIGFSCARDAAHHVGLCLGA